jgi:hypothetical protein
VLRDQRFMTGEVPLDTPAQVRAAWQAFAELHGFVDETGLRVPGSPLIEDELELVAHVSDSRWVADCPCGGGIAAWPLHRKGCCLDCGHVFAIKFPPADELPHIVAVLEARPDPRTRYFDPRAGEELIDLKAQNAANGIVFATPSRSS